MSLDEPKRISAPRQMFSLRVDDIEGAQPKKVFRRKDGGNTRNYQQSSEFWKNPWPEQDAPQHHHIRHNPVNTKKVSYPGPHNDEAFGKSPVPKTTGKKHYEPVRSSFWLHDGDALDQFEKEFSKKQGRQMLSNPEYYAGENNSNLRRSQPSLPSSARSMSQNQEPIQNTFEQSQRDSTEDLERAAFEKNYNAFFRGYTPSENQRYNFIDALEAPPKVQVKTNVDPESLSFKINAGKFFGEEASHSEEDRFKKNFANFYGLRTGRDFSLDPKLLNSNDDIKNEPKDIGSYRKVETFDIITGNPIVKYIPLNRSSLNLANFSNRAGDYKKMEVDKYKEISDPNYLLNKQKFFGMPEAFKQTNSIKSPSYTSLGVNNANYSNYGVAGKSTHYNVQALEYKSSTSSNLDSALFNDNKNRLELNNFPNPKALKNMSGIELKINNKKRKWNDSLIKKYTYDLDNITRKKHLNQQCIKM